MRRVSTSARLRTADLLADKYDALGFYGCAARARVAAYLVNDQTRSIPRDLLTECRQFGRQWEVSQLRGKASRKYPIVFA